MCLAAECGPTFECEGDRCVSVSICEEVTCRTNGSDPGRCAMGECRGDACASVSTCEDNELCCGPDICAECAPLPDSPCVRNVCVGTGCGTEPLERGVDCFNNGLFCDGRGVCDGMGACVPGPTGAFVTCQGDESECDESNDQCLGCIDADGCTDIVTDNNCPGSIGPTECSGSVIPMRTVVNCVDFRCIPQGEAMPDPIRRCMRDAGTLCGDPIIGAEDQCMYADEDCSTTGTTQRDITDFFCSAGGSCDEVPRIEQRPRSCDRPSMEGESCSVPRTDPEIGMCGDFATCSVDGTQSVLTYRSICQGEVCNPSGDPQALPPQACTRPSQNGETCGGGNMETAWSACTQAAGSMSCTGTQTRTVTTRMCGGGSCQVDVDMQTRNCPLNGMESCGSLGPCEVGGGGAVCRGQRNTPVCVAGACDMDNFFDTNSCDLPDTVPCGPNDPGTCTFPNGDCTGERIPTRMRCNGSGACSPQPLPAVVCFEPEDTACRSGGACSQGTCDAIGNCDGMAGCVDSDCDAGSGCSGTTCTCMSNACACM